jgi:hypothetical protein
MSEELLSVSLPPCRLTRSGSGGLVELDAEVLGSLPRGCHPTAVNRAFSDTKVNDTVSAPGDGFTRNWQLAYFLKEIVREFRGE